LKVNWLHVKRYLPNTCHAYILTVDRTSMGARLLFFG
jgi:hypothetical protein